MPPSTKVLKQEKLFRKSNSPSTGAIVGVVVFGVKSIGVSHLPPENPVWHLKKPTKNQILMRTKLKQIHGGKSIL